MEADASAWLIARRNKAILTYIFIKLHKMIKNADYPFFVCGAGQANNRCLGRKVLLCLLAKVIYYAILSPRNKERKKPKRDIICGGEITDLTYTIARNGT